MVRPYFSQSLTSISSFVNKDQSESLQLVLDLMCSVNLVAAAEAISFARHLGVDLDQFYGLVREAAGASQQFIKNGVMIKGMPGDKSQTVDKIVSQLEIVVQKARDLHCPLHLGNATLSQLLFAQRAGFGREASTSVIKTWH